jgi:hypothetical protein
MLALIGATTGPTSAIGRTAGPSAAAVLAAALTAFAAIATLGLTLSPRTAYAGTLDEAVPPPAASAPASAAGTVTSSSSVGAATDYADPGHWLCWPGRADDACAVDLAATVIEADGRTHLEAFHADPKPPIDCFYVYPTVSTDPGLIATLTVEPEERRVAGQQFARFGSQCRLFAPMYRQITLNGLRAMLFGIRMPGSDDPAIWRSGYDDVVAAWNYYLAHENHGRGVVLIGHSQGSKVLDEFIKANIDGKPAQSLLVSAILMGENLLVPAGADVGGDFKSIPLCRRAGQTGCAIAFSSFRAEAPPPPDSLFGRPRTPSPGLVAACVNPAALAGGPGTLKPYFSANSELISGGVATPMVWSKDATVTTPFVTLPGLLTAQCASTDGANYLAISIDTTPGPRTHEIPGDLVRRGLVLKEWGLHLIDANLTIGNLLDVVRAEAAAWQHAH